MEDYKKELHDKAWESLKEKGFKIGEMINIRASFVEWSGYKYEYPFISLKRNRDKKEYYNSDIKEIAQYNFDTENEVILANAIYENIKDRFNPNDFVQLLKFTFRILGINSDWSK